MRLQPRRQLGGRVLIGEQELDRVETVGRRGRKAVEEGVLVVEHRQVGGEMRHGVLSAS
jgi:hypothetical protein